MTVDGQIELAVRLERERCERIASFEVQYWKELDDRCYLDRPDLGGICLGAIGAAANVLAAIATGEAPKARKD